MNNSNRKEIHLGDLVQGNEYDLERYTSDQSSSGYNLFTNYVYNYANYEQNDHPHLTLYFDKITPSGRRTTGGDSMESSR